MEENDISYYRCPIKVKKEFATKSEVSDTKTLSFTKGVK
jgi:hypothetical protein